MILAKWRIPEHAIVRFTGDDLMGKLELEPGGEP